MDAIAVAVVLGACIGGFVQGLSGFAFGLVAMSVWAWSVTPELAAPMVVFGSLVGQLMSLGSIRKNFDLRRALPFLIGGLTGVPIGVAALARIDPTLFKLFVGAVLTLYCSVLLFLRALPHVSGGAIPDAVIGVIGGAMGGLGGLNGPAPTLWCVLRGWPPATQRAVFQPFILMTHILTMMLYASSGLLTMETARMFLLIGPAMIVPVLLGTFLFKQFSDAGYRRLVLVLLLLSGITLLVHGTGDLLGR
jgi:uncharacterized membrane protein YfcA